MVCKAEAEINRHDPPDGDTGIRAQEIQRKRGCRASFRISEIWGGTGRQQEPDQEAEGVIRILKKERQ